MPHVTFIHGIANKPEKELLLRIWRESLARDGGVDLGAEGVTSSMVYWADVLYDRPQQEMAEYENTDTVIAREDPEIDMGWQAEPADEEEAAWVAGIASKLNFDAEAPDADEEYAPRLDDMEELERLDFERIPLPWWLKRRLMKVLLRDVHHYLFNKQHSPRDGVTYRVQEEIRQRFVAALQAGAATDGPHVVVSHSMGTVIAYDCLKRVDGCPAVDALMTIGSPLGLDEVQDKLKPGWSRSNGFPAERLRSTDWVNVYDRLDPVAGFDPNLANDFQLDRRRKVDDINEQNYGRWRHNISKYLGGRELRAALRRQLEL
jgi:hypothetical protein